MRQVRRCAAAEEKRSNRMRRPQARKLDLQRSKVSVDALVLPDGDGEIAIAAMMAQNGTCT